MVSIDKLGMIWSKSYSIVCSLNKENKSFLLGSNKRCLLQEIESKAFCNYSMEKGEKKNNMKKLIWFFWAMNTRRFV